MAQAIGIQTNGQIIVGGSSTNNSITSFALVRYNIDGSIDTTFGNNGFVTTFISTGSTIYTLAIQPNQQICVAGSAGLSYAGARYNTDGSLDTSFGIGGYLSVSGGIDFQSIVYAMTFQQNGKIIGSGFGKSGTVESQMVVARSNTNGFIDLTFGNYGFMFPIIGNRSIANSVTLDSNENIIASGFTKSDQGSESFLVIRLTSSGTFDSSFGTNGIVISNIEDSSSASNVIIQNDGQILVSGTSFSSSMGINQFAIVRYNNDGSFDNTFGSNGIITTSIGNGATANSSCLQNDGKIIVVGSSLNQETNNLEFTLARYNSNNLFSLNISYPTNSSTVTTKTPPLLLTSSAIGAEVDILIDGSPYVTGLLSTTGAFYNKSTLPLTNTAHSISANLILSGLTFLSTQNIFNVDSPDTEIGNTLRVDSIFGSDTNGLRNGFPFKTITAALSASQNGDVIWVYPGTYNEYITLPENISLHGISPNACSISKQNVNEDIDLITMGENSSIENMNLTATSTGHYNIRGIVLPGTTSITSKIKNTNLLIDNSSAWSTGTSNIYGIHSNGTGVSYVSHAINNCNININSAGSGNKRGILSDTNNSLSINSTNICVMGTTGSFGIETNSTGAKINIYSSYINSKGSDISQTLGSINLGQTVLEHSTANNLGFSVKNFTSKMIFANPGNVNSNSILFMYPGTYITTTNEIQINMNQDCLIRSLSIIAQTGPGGTLIDTFTLRKNGIDTTLTTSLVGDMTNNSNNSVSVNFEKNDLLSLKIETSLDTMLSNVTVVLDVY